MKITKRHSLQDGDCADSAELSNIKLKITTFLEHSDPKANICNDDSIVKYSRIFHQEVC